MKRTVVALVLSYLLLPEYFIFYVAGMMICYEYLIDYLEDGYGR